ncbi:MAG TPA: 2-oxoacid:acceptor oxidoreductase family protein [Candidatus Omnitrophota bacterium]|nr:2-oxoacid:acceptor oxidoreductase family protein [Candidatus Omnitrophota bacterium]HRZ14313.1 2-oxoacid:acceptor oxidoreductase family protein [Candidatus Omnitrophota bacterium]
MVKNNGTVNILFCGTGGQGVLVAAEICGWAAVFEGFHVKKSEVHGMAQRGGSVESHLRFGKQVYSPLIPRGTADFLVSYYRDESLRLRVFLKPRGVDLTAELDRADGSVADKRYINVFILGALSRHLALSEGSWFKAIDAVLARKNPEENKKVFLAGRGEGL